MHGECEALASRGTEHLNKAVGRLFVMGSVVGSGGGG